MADKKVNSLNLTRRRMLTTLAVVGGGGAAAGAGTYAAFSDSETSSGNSVSATTLDLEVDPDGTGAVTSISTTDILPGTSEYLVIHIKNTGRSDGTIDSISLSTGTSSEDGGDGTDDGADSEGNKDTTDGGEIEENTTFDLLIDVDSTVTEGVNSGSYSDADTTNTNVVVNGGTLSTELGSSYAPSESLTSGTSKYLIYDYSVASGTGTDNDMQDDSISFDITVNLSGNNA